MIGYVQVHSVINMTKEYAGPEEAYRAAGIEQLRLNIPDTFAPTSDVLDQGVEFARRRIQQLTCAGTGRSFSRRPPSPSRLLARPPRAPSTEPSACRSRRSESKLASLRCGEHARPFRTAGPRAERTLTISVRWTLRSTLFRKFAAPLSG